ncbi:MAG: T9SS type A sorting domain-containing protein [Saprospiraceae bacterium]|nr:T9SS type A sorting domain-containing protein [Candidatus Vicinibacter affinis]
MIQITVSPNPVKDLLFIDLGTQNIKNQQVNVVDPSGKVVYQGKMVSSKHTINVNKWPKGTYMVQVIDENNAWGMETILIQ